VPFPTDHIVLGPQTYGIRPRTFGVVIHTTEGPNSSLEAGLETIRMQSPGGSLFAEGGSYHFILTDAGPILSVPFLEAAGGISGDHTPPSQGGVWAPDRFPWLRQMLPLEAYLDPNNYLLQISVSGRTGDLQDYPNIQDLARDAARIIAWGEDQPEFDSNLVVMGHLNWQTDRSDPSQWFIDQVMARYADVKPPPRGMAPSPTGPKSRRALVAPVAPVAPEDPHAGEVLALRVAHPQEAAFWHRTTGWAPDFDGPILRESRLAAELLYTRLAHADTAERWIAMTRLTGSRDGQPLPRGDRLAAEVLYLRRVASGQDAEPVIG
jgi:hypothetical protein